MEGKAPFGKAGGKISFADLWLRVIRLWLHVYLEIDSGMATHISDRYARSAVSGWFQSLKRSRIWAFIASASQKELAFDLEILVVSFGLPTLSLLCQSLHRSTPLHLFYRDTIPTVPIDGCASRARKVLESMPSIIEDLAAGASAISTGLVDDIHCCVCRACVAPRGWMRLVDALVSRYGKADATNLAVGLEVLHLAFVQE